MKVAILESIVMPAGHEVEFDRILVDELNKQGHKPIFFVPENFPFKLDYNAEIEYLSGGEAVTYAGVRGLEKIWRSIQREIRRRCWFNHAYEKATNGDCDAIIIPTATYRYLRTTRNSKLKNSPVPVVFIVHGINPGEIDKFINEANACRQHENLSCAVITLRDDFGERRPSNVNLILPPVYKPHTEVSEKKLNANKVLRLGFLGQYRREKNLDVILEAFRKASFNCDVEFFVQGATADPRDKEDFEKIITKYNDDKRIIFCHKSLIGEEWEKAILSVDVLMMPYANERYKYHWGAMLFTAIGFNKTVLQSSDLNPEVIEEFDIGEFIKDMRPDELSKQIESFVNGFDDKRHYRETNLDMANKKFSQAKMIKNIIDIINEKNKFDNKQ